MILLIFLDNFTSSDFIQSIPFLAKIFNWFSTEARFVGFSQGLFSLSDLFFFLSISAVIVIWTIIIIEKRRQSRA